MYKFLHLSTTDQGLLVTSMIVVTWFKLALQVLPFRTLHRISVSHRLPNNPLKATNRRVAKRRIMWAVEIASRRIPGGATCLTRALAALLMLRWHGYTANLRIGVMKSGESEVQAHAWIESDQEILAEDLLAISRFTPLRRARKVTP